MRSNRLDEVFGFTCFGESHGPAMGIVIEDIKPGVDFPFSELTKLLSLRKPNQSLFASPRNETDEFQILSGVWDGKTTGTPICILFWNKDANSADYETIKHIFRPGHAEFSWYKKFKIYDYRGGGRASGRETISRIAASAFVDDLLGNIRIGFQTIRVGLLSSADSNDYLPLSKENPFCWSNSSDRTELYDYLSSIKSDNDTVGGIVRIKIENVPSGLGDPVFAKLSAMLTQAIMSIGSVKGVALGDGFALGSMQGSEANDWMDETGFLSNHAGGILGGVSTGQPIIITVAVKPVPSHGKLQHSIDTQGNAAELKIAGRHDVCHIPRLLPVMEAMIKLTLADAIAQQKLISDETLSMVDYREALDKLDEELLIILHKRKSIVNLVKKFKSSNNIAFRDNIRESMLLERWKNLATEFDLDKDNIALLLNLVLEICRK